MLKTKPRKSTKSTKNIDWKIIIDKRKATIAKEIINIIWRC
jgi:hypothetical protein